MFRHSHDIRHGYLCRADKQIRQIYAKTPFYVNKFDPFAKRSSMLHHETLLSFKQRQCTRTQRSFELYLAV